MTSRLSKTPTAVYVAEVTPIPTRPAFCVTETRLVGYSGSRSSGSSSGGGSMVYSPSNPANPSYGGALGGGSWVYIPPEGKSGGSGSSSGSALKPRTVSTTTCYPEVPGRAGSPARTDYQANTGWNAGARSRNVVPTFGEFAGTLPASLVATQFGLARRSFDHTYAAMTHSLVARQGEWTIVEQGLTKARGNLPSQARVAVRREGGKVTYWVNNIQVYASAAPLTGTAYGAALLYSLADAVDAPAIVRLAQVLNLYAEAPRWRMLGSDAPVAGVTADAPRAILLASLKRVHGVSSFSADAPRFSLLGADRPVAVMNARWPAPALRATMGARERVPNQLLAIMPPPILSMNLRRGGRLSVDAQAPRMVGVGSDRPVAFMRAEKPILAYVLAGEPYLPTDEFDGMDNVIAQDQSQLDAALVLLALDSLDVSSSASLTVVIELSTMDSVRLADAASFGQLVEMLAMDRVAVYSSTSSAQHQAIQYAVNAISGAPTSYVGFDFSSFATVGGVTYGIRADGLYRIGDSLDNGETIDALIDFGTSDFGSAQVKRMEAAYLGLRTDGQCYLRVRADAGAERVYRVRGGDNVRKSMLAKGLAARSWSLALEVADASFAEVDSLEMLVGATQRRGSGYRTR